MWGGNGAIRRRVVLPGLEGHVLSQPCGGGQGGDVYYVTACSMGLMTRVCLADVAGHGEAVSAMSRWLHTTLASRINRHDDVGIFHELNGRVLRKGHYALTTAASFTYDATTGELHYCYAGHPPILHYRRRDCAWFPLELQERGGVRNVAFGAARDVGYDMGTTKLEPGDRLLVYSDGVTETPDTQRHRFGDDGLRSWLAEHAEEAVTELAEGLAGSLCRYAGRDEFDHDDVTVLAFEARPLLSGNIFWLAAKNRYRRWQIHRQRPRRRS